MQQSPQPLPHQLRGDQGVELFVGQLRESIRGNLSRGQTDLGATARRLGMSGRTLQRRLNLIGLQYSSVLDEVRRDECCRLLSRTRLRAADIGMLAGFADPSSFSRAFKRWTGLTPREFRRTTDGQ